jgi:hypothetical protein
MERDSVIPGKSGPAEIGEDLADAASPLTALGYLDKLIALQETAHQSPRMKAILGRDVAAEAAGVTVSCMRKLDALSRSGHQAR